MLPFRPSLSLAKHSIERYEYSINNKIFFSEKCSNSTRLCMYILRIYIYYCLKKCKSKKNHFTHNIEHCILLSLLNKHAMDLLRCDIVFYLMP